MFFFCQQSLTHFEINVHETKHHPSLWPVNVSPLQDRSSSASGLRTPKNCPNVNPLLLKFVALVDLLKNTFGGHIFSVKTLHVSIFERLKAWNQQENFWIEYIDKGFFSSELHLCFPHDKSNSKCSREEGKDKASEATLHGDQNQRCELDNLWYKFNQRTLAPSGPISHLCKISRSLCASRPQVRFEGWEVYDTFSTIFFGFSWGSNLAPWLLKHFCGFPNVPYLKLFPPAKSIREAQSSSSYCANVATSAWLMRFSSRGCACYRHWLLPILLMLDNLKEQDWTHQKASVKATWPLLRKFYGCQVRSDTSRRGMIWPLDLQWPMAR